MFSVINSLLDLWDPYELYCFPKDEYTSYVMPIQKFITENKDVDVNDLTEFVYKILPPIEQSNDKSSDKFKKAEYERFAKTLLLFLNR